MRLASLHDFMLGWASTTLDLERRKEQPIQVIIIIVIWVRVSRQIQLNVRS